MSYGFGKTKRSFLGELTQHIFKNVI